MLERHAVSLLNARHEATTESGEVVVDEGLAAANTEFAQLVGDELECTMRHVVDSCLSLLPLSRTELLHSSNKKQTAPRKMAPFTRIEPCTVFSVAQLCNVDESYVKRLAVW